MYCENCGENIATSHFKTIINGKTSEAHLCAECAAKLGYQPLFHSFGIDDMLTGFLGYNKGASPAKPNTAVCPLCNTTLDEIAQTGRIGCGECYEVFREQLMPYIRKIHGSATHTGRMPKNLKLSPKRRIKQLEDEMEKAVAAQDFEKAAEIRDEIKKLRGEN